MLYAWLVATALKHFWLAVHRMPSATKIGATLHCRPLDAYLPQCSGQRISHDNINLRAEDNKCRACSYSPFATNDNTIHSTQINSTKRFYKYDYKNKMYTVHIYNVHIHSLKFYPKNPGVARKSCRLGTRSSPTCGGSRVPLVCTRPQRFWYAAGAGGGWAAWSRFCDSSSDNSWKSWRGSKVSSGSSSSSPEVNGSSLSPANTWRAPILGGMVTLLLRFREPKTSVLWFLMASVAMFGCIERRQRPTWGISTSVWLPSMGISNSSSSSDGWLFSLGGIW